MSPAGEPWTLGPFERKPGMTISAAHELQERWYLYYGMASSRVGCSTAPTG